MLSKGGTDLIMAAAVIMVVFMMIIPMPTIFLDLFMILNLMLSILILMIVLFTKEPLEFSIFPTMLLITTFFGLALNVSSTRLILSKGSQFDGTIVRAFAGFVTGTSGTQGIVIGMILFIIIIAVQMMVITKGASRVSEVAARFTLDALPNKHMAIDQEFNSGVISEQEYRKRKSDLQRTADFYGAMDGASKFVSGNVKVGIIITLINIIGGFIVGMSIHQESLGVAAQTYTSLTIGDGLVSQLPSLIISMATGMVVTRSVADDSFGTDVKNQFTRDGRVYWVAAGFLIVLGVLPGFPGYLLFPLGGLMGFLAWRSGRVKEKEAQKEQVQQEKEKTKQKPSELAPIQPLDPLSLELGYGLIPLVNEDQGAELLERVRKIRKEAAIDLGLMVPPIRIVDNMRLEHSEYSFKIKGVENGRGTIRLGSYLAINPGGVSEEIKGEKTTDPTYHLPAVWITGDQRPLAERMGYTVVDPPSIIATHLTEIIKRSSSEILGRQEIKTMLDALKETYPAVVEEATKLFSHGEIQKILQNLLKEQVSVRNLVSILETLCDWGGHTKESGWLTEKVRQKLGRQICQSYTDGQNRLFALTLDGEIEQNFIQSRVETADGYVAGLEPAYLRKFINAMANAIKSQQDQGFYPVVLTSEMARPLVRSSIRKDFPSIPVISVLEVSDDIQLDVLGAVSLERGEP